jgi:hypothetical protein
MNEGAVLGTVGVPDEMRNVLHQLWRIDGILFRKLDFGVLCALKQLSDERMLGDALAGGPGLRIEIPVHEELAEAEERQREMPPDRPGLLEFEDVRESCEIALRRILFFQWRHFQPEIPSHFFY